MRFKTLLLAIIIPSLTIIFSGCGQSAFKVFKPDTYTTAFDTVFDPTKVYQDTLQYTHKADIINSKNEVEAMLHATYLNSTAKGWDNPSVHSFIVGIFIVNDEDKKYLDHEDYKLTISNTNKFNIESLDGSKQILGSIPIENRWAKYYLIQVPSSEIKSKGKNITIEFYNIKLNKKTKLDFIIHN